MSALAPMRYLEIAPIEHDGEAAFRLDDPLGVCEGTLILSPHALFIAVQFDGQNDVAAVREAFGAQFGLYPDEEDILQLYEGLETQGYMLTPTFYARRDELVAAYAAEPVRPAYFAGRGYPNDPEALRTYFDSLFTDEEGPGLPQQRGGDDTPPLPGLIVPHLDYPRGGLGYAHGYARLVEAGRPSTVFIFGVAHQAPPVPFILTRKDFETPFGTLETNQAMVDALAETCTWDPFAHELVHRTEHSIELQTTLLAYCFGTDLTIVPVLCAPCGDGDEAFPHRHPAVQAFLAKCRDFVQAPEHRATVIASADLAHVGRAFGDDFDIDDDIELAMADRDHEDLEHALQIRGDDWFASVMRDDNARRVCGLNCIYATLKSIEGRASGGELLYGEAAEDPSGGIVTFVAAALH